MSLSTPFITTHAVESATRGLNQNSKEQGQTLKQLVSPTNMRLTFVKKKKSVGELMTDAGRKTKIRTNQSHHIGPTGRKMQQRHIPFTRNP